MPSIAASTRRSVACAQAGARSEKPVDDPHGQEQRYIFTPKSAARMTTKVWFEDTIARRYALTLAFAVLTALELIEVCDGRRVVAT